MRPSLWVQYCEELLGGDRIFIEMEHGFVSYSFPVWSNTIMIHDMYIVPDRRKSGLGRELFERVCWIGREAGKTSVLAEVEMKSKVAAESLKAQLAVGLVPISANEDKILTRKAL